MQTPSSKFQVPKKLQNSNLKAWFEVVRDWDVWNLELEASLELGTWNLELPQC